MSLSLADADLYLNLGTPPDIVAEAYECASLELDSNETCTVRNAGDSGTLWATVYAIEVGRWNSLDPILPSSILTLVFLNTADC